MNPRPHRQHGPFPPDSGCGRRRRLIRQTWLVALAWLLPSASWAVTHSGLLDDPKMNAKRFANCFADFRYEFHSEIQPVDYFLGSQRGDCDDYAILAAHILSRRSYHTRLVRIELVGTNISHVVCYVTEQKAYLDYNNRRVYFNLERSKPTLRAIAEKVADSFEKNWTSATEYTYSYANPRQRTVWTVVKTEPAELDPDTQPSSPTP